MNVTWNVLVRTLHNVENHPVTGDIRFTECTLKGGCTFLSAGISLYVPNDILNFSRLYR